MRALRRHDYSPRIELTPLIDVVFLLLTFFIYSVAMMVRAQVMPVALTPIDASASMTSHDARIDAITVNRQGRVYYNRQMLTSEQLKSRLADLAKMPPASRPRLFLAMEAAGDRDRAPLLLGIIEQIRTAGIKDFAIVGQPQTPAAAGPDSPSPPAAPGTPGTPGTPGNPAP